MNQVRPDERYARLLRTFNSTDLAATTDLFNEPSHRGRRLGEVPIAVQGHFLEPVQSFQMRQKLREHSIVESWLLRGRVWDRPKFQRLESSALLLVPDRGQVLKEQNERVGSQGQT